MLTNIQRRVRLILQGNLNNTEIAQLTSCSRNTVANWRQAITGIENAHETLAGLDDAALRRQITPGVVKRTRAFATPDFKHIAFECAERGVQIKTLYDEYCATVAAGQQIMSRSSFYRAVEAYLDKKNVVMSFEYAPGEMFQCDFVGRKKLKQPVLMRDDGQEGTYELFCAVSAKSRMVFLIAIESQAKMPTLDAFGRMMTFFGGVPVLVTIDNFPAAVATPRRGQKRAKLTPEFQDLADFYGFSMIAARVRKPRDKGLVENAVGIVQNDVLAKLRNRRFFSLAEMNAAITEYLTALNQRPMPGHHHKSRDDLFNEADTIGLQTLPALSFSPGKWLLKLRVGRDYHIFADGNRYSVPARHVGETVDAKVTVSSVHIHRCGKLIATHRRAKIPGAPVTAMDHMPTAHRDVAMTRLIGIKRAVQCIGRDAEQFIDAHYRSGKSPAGTASVASSLNQLAKIYTAKRVNEACRRANLIGKRTAHTIENILSGGLDVIETAITPDAVKETLPKANVHGSAYFVDTLITKKGDKSNG